MENEKNKGVPVYLGNEEPNIIDPSTKSNERDWDPANAASLKLMNCLEGVRDLKIELQAMIQNGNLSSDKRVVKRLVTPLYNFTISIEQLFNELEGNRKEYQNLQDAQLKELGCKHQIFKKLGPLKDNSLKTIRDKISSHIDKKLFQSEPQKIWNLVDIQVLMNGLAVCIECLLYLLGLDVYAWSKESGLPQIWSLMATDGNQANWLMENGKPRSLISMVLTKSPKYAV